MNEMDHTLHDWQSSKESVIGVKVAIESKEIRISEPDCAERWGRSVWVEFEDGVLRVHCYDGAHEEPVSVDIREGEIKISSERDDE